MKKYTQVLNKHSHFKPNGAIYQIKVGEAHKLVMNQKEDYGKHGHMGCHGLHPLD